MAKRFSRLKYALRTIQSPTGTSNNQPAAGSILEKFQQYQVGGADINYPRAATSKPKSLLQFAVQPFAFAVGTTYALVPLSQRVDENTGIDAVQTACNLAPATTAGAAIFRGFIPAKVTVMIKGAQSDTQKFSQITGIPYNPVEGASYTLPYGKSATNENEMEVRNAITAAANVAWSLNFNSERL